MTVKGIDVGCVAASAAGWASLPCSIRCPSWRRAQAVAAAWSSRRATACSRPCRILARRGWWRRPGRRTASARVRHAGASILRRAHLPLLRRLHRGDAVWLRCGRERQCTFSATLPDGQQLVYNDAQTVQAMGLMNDYFNEWAIVGVSSASAAVPAMSPGTTTAALRRPPRSTRTAARSWRCGHAAPCRRLPARRAAPGSVRVRPVAAVPARAADGGDRRAPPGGARVDAAAAVARLRRRVGRDLRRVGAAGGLGRGVRRVDGLLDGGATAGRAAHHAARRYRRADVVPRRRAQEGAMRAAALARSGGTRWRGWAPARWSSSEMRACGRTAAARWRSARRARWSRAPWRPAATARREAATAACRLGGSSRGWRGARRCGVPCTAAARLRHERGVRLRGGRAARRA